MSQYQQHTSKWQPTTRETCLYLLKKSKKPLSAEEVARKLEIDLSYSRVLLSNFVKTGDVKITTCKCCHIGRKYKA